MSWRVNLSALQERLAGRAPPLCRFAVPGEQAQISDLITAPKTHPTPESLLGLHPAGDTCRVARRTSSEFWNGGEVAGAGFVLKSVAEDNGALEHRRIYRPPEILPHPYTWVHNRDAQKRKTRSKSVRRGL